MEWRKTLLDEDEEPREEEEAEEDPELPERLAHLSIHKRRMLRGRTAQRPRRKKPAAEKAAAEARAGRGTGSR